jgi:DNA-binding GntR family transcriptional regulator
MQAIELVPNEAPRLVLEPWGTVIEATAGVYKGKQSKVIRLWGRRRLALLKRFLPYADTIDVALLGNGMPSFWTLTGESVSLTLAMTGFTSSNWSQALNFDLLLPRHDVKLDEQEAVIKHLQEHYSGTITHIAKQLGLTKKAVQTALQQACQQGLVMFDSQQGCYRYRPLIDEPLDLSLFQYRHPAEKLAYDLVTRQKAVGKLTLQTIPQQGIEVSATMSVAEDKRDYLSVLRLNEEGHVAKAECSCHQIMKHGLQQGACSHLIALRIVYSQHLAQRNAAQITHETRAYTRRKKHGEENYQLTLNSQRLLMKWSVANRPRQQQLAFNSVKEARLAYLTKIQQLEKNGFIDMTTG